MIRDYFDDFTLMGLSVIPIKWDVKTKMPVSHRLWSNPDDLKLRSDDNALMIRTDNDFACLDFDLKNTDKKSLFDEWKAVILNQWPGLYEKLYIEKTRNAGYHAWFKYKKLDKKLSLADSEKGNEVIALYAKGPLVYTFPTPGYSEVQNSMNDIEYLTEQEFDYLITSSQSFNEYKPTYDPALKAVNYPKGHESLLAKFDTEISDEIFEVLLDQIGLEHIKNHRRKPTDTYLAYKRKESTSPGISAKVYFHSKRVLIFTASMPEFPNWHNKHDYPIWSLPPSFLIFYKNNRSWESTIDEVRTIMESAGIDIPEEGAEIKTDYPIHVFPEHIANSMIEVAQARSIPLEFVTTAGLWTISSMAGTRYESDFNGEGKNILFCLMIAPVSVGKTPAYKVMCETPLKSAQESKDTQYSRELTEWEENKEKAKENKKAFTDKRPTRYIPIAKDGTTEGYIQKSMGQPTGIGVYQDEAETILNAGSFKSNNDAISFFTQAFSGGRVTQIRADESKERVVPNLNLNLLMGTQPSRLNNIFTEDRLSSGFASRFLMIESDYKQLNVNSDPFGRSKEMCDEWRTIVTDLYFGGFDFNSGNGKSIRIIMSDNAKDVYRAYYRKLLEEANSRMLSKAESYIMGTEAKMSAYFPRLCQILAIIENHNAPEITEQVVHNGWTLYRYYAESTIRIIAGMHGEIDSGLPKELDMLYQALPDEFTKKEALEVCTRLNLKPRRFEFALRRKDFSSLVRKIAQGKYRKQ